MSTHVAVCPSVVPAHTSAMRRGCLFPVMVVDNTVRNRGVAASWNLGIDLMRERSADWLVIVSASVRFGPSGGMDFLAALDDDDAIAVEGAPHLGWHLIAIRSEVFDRVGLFDENFHPGYLEETDFSRRVALAYDLDPPYWRKVQVDAHLTGYGEAVKAAGITIDNEALSAYERRKWGGHPGDPGATLHGTPFGLDVPLSWWPPHGHPLGSGLMP